MGKRIFTFVSTCLLSAVLIPASAQVKPPPKPQAEVLTNADVIEMVKLGLGESVIVEKIRQSNGGFDTSLTGLKQLKAAKVSDAVLAAMLNPHPSSGTQPKSGPPQPNTEPPTSPQLEVGFYYVNREGKPVEVQPEISTWRQGGVLKKIASAGVINYDINGSIQKPHSPLQIGMPAEFIVRCAEGVAVSEYQLLKLHENQTRREFRMITGGSPTRRKARSATRLNSRRKRSGPLLTASS